MRRRPLDHVPDNTIHAIFHVHVLSVFMRQACVKWHFIFRESGRLHKRPKPVLRIDKQGRPIRVSFPRQARKMEDHFPLEPGAVRRRRRIVVADLTHGLQYFLPADNLVHRTGGACLPAPGRIGREQTDENRCQIQSPYITASCHMDNRNSPLKKSIQAASGHRVGSSAGLQATRHELTDYRVNRRILRS